MSAFYEPLEERQLMSAVHGKASVTIANDLSRIANDKAIIIRDLAANRALVIADRAAIPAGRANDLAVIRADTIKLRQDVGNSIAEQTDRGQILIDRAKFRSDLAALQGRVRSDIVSGHATLALDRAQLRADQLKLRDDRIAGA